MELGFGNLELSWLWESGAFISSCSVFKAELYTADVQSGTLKRAKLILKCFWSFIQEQGFLLAAPFPSVPSVLLEMLVLFIVWELRFLVKHLLQCSQKLRSFNPSNIWDLGKTRLEWPHLCIFQSGF